MPRYVLSAADKILDVARPFGMLAITTNGYVLTITIAPLYALILSTGMKRAAVMKEHLV